MNKTAKSSSALPAYKNPALPPERRTKDLLSRMTVEEKAAQMVCVWQQKAETLVDSDGRLDITKARRAFKKGRGMGQVGRPSDAGKGLSPRQTAEVTNAIQRFFLEESRLGIPVIFHEECLHGQAAVGGTSFPQPIGLGATFDTELVEALYTMTAAEARSRGAHQALTPVVDVARDPRWGRVEETFGEDPFLAAQLGVAAVRGFQGDGSFRDKTRLIATLKHMAGHGQPESGMNCAPANVSDRLLREIFLYPFEQAIKRAGAISVMASYNEIDGVPSHANRWLLRDVLRGEWGFEGFVVSDYYAIWELSYRPDTHGHFVAKDKKEACALAVEAGVNIELPEPDCYLHLVELVRKGVLEESQLDELVAPMLLWKFRLGLFDDPYVDPAHAEALVGCQAHAELALQAARETITLLKNEGNVLPLDPATFKTIAVIGPNANRPLLGGYSGTPPHCSTVFEGIRDRVAKLATVVFAEGCKITQPGSWNQDEVLPSDPEEDAKLIADAVKTARKADVIVLAIGGNEQTSREAWSLKHMGDRASLDLIGRQAELLDRLAALGKPMIALVFDGRPLSIGNVVDKTAAVVQCWYLGQETGQAVAEALFGDINPSGKLPITIPRSVGHLPVFYNHKPSARRGYLFDDVSPLFAFGFGLSYTTFQFSEPRLSKTRMARDGSAKLSIDITNVGTRSGAEVVQLYIRDCVSSVTRPIKELKGFQRVILEPGQTRTVTFEIKPELLAFWDINMRYTVEPGDFELMVGNSSRDGDLQKIMLRVI